MTSAKIKNSSPRTKDVTYAVNKIIDQDKLNFFFQVKDKNGEISKLQQNTIEMRKNKSESQINKRQKQLYSKHNLNQ